MPAKSPEAVARYRIYQRLWYLKNKARVLATRQRKINPAARQREYELARLRKFKITREQLETIWKSQQGLCGICGEMFLSAFDGFIDHDHETGRVRGLLCNGCNTGLGMFKESCHSLAHAITYLKRTKP